MMFYKILTALTLFLSASQGFAAIGANQSIFNGGGVIDGANPAYTQPIGAPFPIVLIAGIDSSTGGNRLGFYRHGTQYQVSAGKTLFCPYFYITTAATESGGLAFGYNTGSFSNNSATGAGDTYFGANVTGVYDAGYNATATYKPVYTPLGKTWPASVYPFVRISASSRNFSVTMHCYEQ